MKSRMGRSGRLAGMRGFVSGTLAKKMGLKIEAAKDADGRRA